MVFPCVSATVRFGTRSLFIPLYDSSPRQDNPTDSSQRYFLEVPPSQARILGVLAVDSVRWLFVNQYPRRLSFKIPRISFTDGHSHSHLPILVFSYGNAAHPLSNHSSPPLYLTPWNATLVLDEEATLLTCHFVGTPFSRGGFGELILVLLLSSNVRRFFLHVGTLLSVSPCFQATVKGNWF